MIKSMTGFGKGEFADKKRHITAEIRSVNHRYSDIAAMRFDFIGCHSVAHGG